MHNLGVNKVFDTFAIYLYMDISKIESNKTLTKAIFESVVQI